MALESDVLGVVPCGTEVGGVFRFVVECTSICIFALAGMERLVGESRCLSGSKIQMKISSFVGGRKKEKEKERLDYGFGVIKTAP